MMQKRFRDRWLVNLGLLAAIGLLISLTLVDKPVPVVPAKMLGDYLPESVNELRIIRSGKEDIHFRLSGNYWHIINPYQARAEDSLIKRLLSLSTLEVDIISEDSKTDRTNFGLLQPVATLQINQQRLHFGSTQPVGKRRYIELDNIIMLIADRHLPQLKAGSISYIDRHLLPQGNQVKSLRINDETINIEQHISQLLAWQTIKANWISLAAKTAVQRGIDVHITLADNPQAIHYIAEKRDADFVLTNTKTRLEYHLAMTASDTLELPLPARDSTPDIQSADQ